MKLWVLLFLLLLGVGIAWGLARDLFSHEKSVLTGTVIAVDPGYSVSKVLPATAPSYRARLPDGRVVDVAARLQLAHTGDEIRITEWMTPWGQFWYTQRD